MTSQLKTLDTGGKPVCNAYSFTHHNIKVKLFIDSHGVIFTELNLMEKMSNAKAEPNFTHFLLVNLSGMNTNQIDID